MVWTTVLFGVLLAFLGVLGYFVADPPFWPAAVPAALGLALIVSGLLALKQTYRKNAMHAAVLLALLGLVGTARSLKQLIEMVLDKPGLIVESVTAVLCGVFMGLAIKSFIDARRRRPVEAATVEATDKGRKEKVQEIDVTSAAE